MPVRLRITLLFGLIVFAILTLVCGSVYYYSYSTRQYNVRARLTNRAITTARLLSQSDVFDQRMLQKIDALTRMSLKDKTLQVYNYLNNKIYSYSDAPADTLQIDSTLLDDARVKDNIYFTIGKKECIAHHYTDNNMRIVIIAAAYDEEGLARLRQLKLILWLSFLGGIFVAFLSGYFFSRRLLTPVRQIADEVNEITAENFTRLIHTGHVHDEWYYLSKTLNNLLNRLQESFEIQRRFIANASHELSTPLTAISSQLEVSLQRDRNAAQYRQVMESVYQDVRHLNNLTQTLLEFAQASGNPGGLEIEHIRIDEILLDMPAEAKKTNAAYTVHLLFDNLPAEDENLLVTGNNELLFTAIKNIVINACKYSPNHKAAIRLTRQKDQLQIFIEDNGIGIPESEWKYIFQPFYRVNNNYPEKGFGLGLSLANRIIKLHKGTIQVQAVAPQGTIFTISLPIAKF